MDNIFIRPLFLPPKVHAVTVIDDNGDFNIYINSEVCETQQKKAYSHELRHVKLNHFYDHDPVIINEMRAQ